MDTNVFNQAGDTTRRLHHDRRSAGGGGGPVREPRAREDAVDTDLVYYAHYSSERSVDPQATARGEFYARA